MATQGLLVVQSTKMDRQEGTPIEVVAARAMRRVVERPGVTNISLLHRDGKQHVALVVVTVDRPANLKSLVGVEVTAIYRSVDARSATGLARKFGDALVTAALQWSANGTTPQPAAVSA